LSWYFPCPVLQSPLRHLPTGGCANKCSVEMLNSTRKTENILPIMESFYLKIIFSFGKSVPYQGYFIFYK
jgi:hypothetical protein